MTYTYTRREFLHRQFLALGVLTVPKFPVSWINKLDAPLKLGVITDLHQDIMHDGLQRLQAFIQAMDEENHRRYCNLAILPYPAQPMSQLLNGLTQLIPRPYM